MYIPTYKYKINVNNSIKLHDNRTTSLILTFEIEKVKSCKFVGESVKLIILHFLLQIFAKIINKKIFD